MIKEIVKDISFLKEPSVLATPDDLYILDDLIDTLKSKIKTCVGMAANMIGYKKTILVYVNEKEEIDYMINPVIIKKSDQYETEEGCLSLDGKRKTIRYDKIKVEYYNRNFQKRLKTFTGFQAEIIEHEIDHFSGIII
ncbi:MAG: peptide deformylase [Acholeplasmatales bacterium]|nr:peptide deformylase [Acholeplasmatales bacterium]